jgi:hypothetical protein
MIITVFVRHWMTDFNAFLYPIPTHAKVQTFCLSLKNIPLFFMNATTRTWYPNHIWPHQLKIALPSRQITANSNLTCLSENCIIKKNWNLKFNMLKICAQEKLNPCTSEIALEFQGRILFHWTNIIITINHVRC